MYQSDTRSSVVAAIADRTASEVPYTGTSKLYQTGFGYKIQMQERLVRLI